MATAGKTLGVPDNIAPPLDRALSSEGGGDALSEELDRLDKLNNPTGSPMIRKMLESLSSVQQVARERSVKRQDDFVRHVVTTIEQGLADKSWRRRKICVDDYADRQLEMIALFRKKEDDENATATLERTYKRLIPMLCDSIWWVRRTTVVALVRVAGVEAPNPVRDVVAGSVLSLAMPEGRYAAARVVMRSKQPSVLESQALIEIMLQALSDEHWMVRTEARGAIMVMCERNDPRVLKRGVQLLRHKSATFRQSGIFLLSQNVILEGRHDAASDQTIAEHILESSLDASGHYQDLDDHEEGRPSITILRHAIQEETGLHLTLRRLAAFLGGKASDARIPFDEFDKTCEKRKTEPLPPEPSTRLIQTIIRDLISNLPVDYSPLAKIAREYKDSLERETDWVTRHKIFAQIIVAIPLADSELPFILAKTLAHVQATKLCVQGIACFRELIRILGWQATQRIEIHRLQRGAPQHTEMLGAALEGIEEEDEEEGKEVGGGGVWGGGGGGIWRVRG